jgi:hypothetical protein
MLFKNPVRTSKRTPQFTITNINWLTLFKFNTESTLNTDALYEIKNIFSKLPAVYTFKLSYAGPHISKTVGHRHVLLPEIT